MVGTIGMGELVVLALVCAGVWVGMALVGLVVGRMRRGQRKKKP